MGTKIVLPFHKGTNLSLSEPLSSYITHEYNDKKATYDHDCQKLDSLRSDAIHATDPNIQNIKKLQAYAAQLIWLTGRLPPNFGVEFAWFPTLSYNCTRPESQESLPFELVNILYNMAALYSSLAMNSHGAEDIHKMAAHYFCLSAGIIKHIQTNVIPTLNVSPPSDMDAWSLQSLEHLMLGQAQEFVWQKAVKDGLKDASIAKIAAKIADLFATAASLGAKSDGILSQWIHHMKARHFHFAAVAQYRAACDCLEKRKYGEEVARLKDALNCVAEGLKESKFVNRDVVEGLNALKSKAQEDLKRAEKDNDVIYLMSVPSKHELKPIDRILMVTPKVPPEISDAISQLGSNPELGNALFSGLPPYAVKISISHYEKRRNEFMNNEIISKLDTLTVKMTELQQALGLPSSLDALDVPLGLPDNVLAHAQEIRQQDGPQRIQRSIQETEKVKAQARRIYHEGVEILEAESAEDEASRRKYGTERWPRQTSEAAAPKLYEKKTQIEGYLAHAQSSDNLILGKLTNNERLILILAGNDNDIRQYVPNSSRSAAPAAVVQAANRLRFTLKDVSRLETQRKRMLDDLKTKVAHDDIQPDLVREAARIEREFPMQKVDPQQLDHIFSDRLRRYDSDKFLVTEQDREQEKVMKRVQEANAEFVTARKGDTSTKQREQALQALQNAYFNYKQILSNLEGGRKFYNDLIQMVTGFRDECTSFAYRRRTEASQVSSDMTPDISKLNLDTKASLQQQKEDEARTTTRMTRSKKAQAQEPLTAPQPTRVSSSTGMWQPELGIRFGNENTTGKEGDSKPSKGPNSKGWNPSQPIQFGKG